MTTNRHPLAWFTEDGPKQDTHSPAYHMARQADAAKTNTSEQTKITLEKPTYIYTHQDYVDMMKTQEDTQPTVLARALALLPEKCSEPYCHNIHHIHVGDYHWGVDLWKLDPANPKDAYLLHRATCPQCCAVDANLGLFAVRCDTGKTLCKAAVAAGYVRAGAGRH